MPTHCQICEREIKANTGLIAHHGYQRPQFAHYQTRSCFGARHRPYEESCDALQPYIDMLADWHARVEGNLAKLRAGPAEMTHLSRDGSGKMIVVPRPDGFDSATAKPGYLPRSYVTLWRHKVAEVEYELRYIAAEQKRATVRFAAWRENR